MFLLTSDYILPEYFSTLNCVDQATSFVYYNDGQTTEYMWKGVMSLDINNNLGQEINDATIYPSYSPKPVGTLAYEALNKGFFQFLCYDDFLLTRAIEMWCDKLKRNYPKDFNRKFSTQELMIIETKALARFNEYSPQTMFYPSFQIVQQGSSVVGTLPPLARDGLITDAARIETVLAMGILEQDTNFSFNDSGAQLQWNREYKQWFDALLADFNENMKMNKKNYGGDWPAVASFHGFSGAGLGRAWSQASGSFPVHVGRGIFGGLA